MESRLTEWDARSNKNQEVGKIKSIWVSTDWTTTIIIIAYSMLIAINFKDILK